MRKFVGILLFTMAIVQAIFAQVPEPVRLPNGWSLSPYGRNFPLGDLPLNIALSASGKKMAVTNNGQSQHSIQLIDPASEQVLHTLVVPKAWYGLAFTEDEKFLYVSGGHDNCINKYDVSGNKLVLAESILLGKPWPNRVGPSGIALDSRNKKLFVATREDSALYTIDMVSNKVIRKISIGAEGYGCQLSKDRKFVYVSVWGGDRLLKIDANTGQIRASTIVGDNPNEIILSKKGDRLFVANANDNSVSVISTATMKVTETLNAALYPDAPSGSASNGLALSADEKRLYIANADNNCLAVFDVEHAGDSRAMGFIPVGWYPTNVRILGKKVFVTNGKGFTSMANPYGPNPIEKKQQVIYQKGDAAKPKDVQYIGGLFKGTMSIF